MQINLKSNWKLALLSDSTFSKSKRTYISIDNVLAIAEHTINATVPGNFELDMKKEGLIDDVFYGMNLEKMKDFEYTHLFYSNKFECTEINENSYFLFEGIDTYSDIYLNGKFIGSTDNMLISHEIYASNLVIGQNELFIHIKPTILEVRKFDRPLFTFALKYNYDAMYVRKPNYMFGWDIFPRIISGGIWKEVSLITKAKIDFLQTYLYTISISKDNKLAKMQFFYELELDREPLFDYKVEITGKCSKSSFAESIDVWAKAGRIEFEIENPLLWWPKGQGKPSLYDIEVKLIKNNDIVISKNFKTGIRTIELDKTEVTDENGSGEFCFIVNHKKFFVLGTNWIPLDSFPSQSKDKIVNALELADDIGCNTIRCWGGGFYEDELFYDICDEKGILIWQDFMMGCGLYPQDDNFIKIIKNEITHVVRKLRQHSCICLWAGDNECDCAYEWAGDFLDPNTNIITRKVIPEIVRTNDYVREYLPSSPYISTECLAKGIDFIPEYHLWGPRDYFKSSFYQDSLAHFASETGYHGCPSVDSIKKFISNDKLWPYEDNPEWLLHASSMTTSMDEPYAFRIKLMANQIKVLFGFIPDNLEEFSLLSQFSQGEAKKFFIERFRMGKWRRTGIIWWNLIDGCPQFSDAVVDYYSSKKAAYNYIKNSQSEVCLMFSEAIDKSHNLFAVNDTKNKIQVSYKVSDIQSGELIINSKCILEENSSTNIFTHKTQDDMDHFLLIEWETDGIKSKNHYVVSKQTINSTWYIKCVKKMGLI